MAHQVAKIKLTKLLAKNHLTAWKENQLTLTKSLIFAFLIINSYVLIMEL